MRICTDEGENQEFAAGLMTGLSEMPAGKSVSCQLSPNGEDGKLAVIINSL